MTKFFVDILKQKGKWHWRLKKRNGRILCHSEKYNTRQACYKTACLMWRVGEVGECKIREVIARGRTILG